MLFRSPSAIGDTEITVLNAVGIVAGQTLTVFDGANTELITVANNYVFGNNTVTLAQPMVYAHDIDTSVSALPSAIKEAVILITTAFLKVRGDSSMTMGIANSASLSQNLGGNLGEEIALAKQLVNPYKRVR